MVTSADLLTDAFGRIRGLGDEVVKGLTADELATRIDGRANSIAWLLWHLTRIQDDHLAEVAGQEQAWMEGWAERFALPFDPSATGYGQSPSEVAAVRVESAELLTGYLDAVHERTVAYVSGLTDSDLERVVDERWDPPVTLGVRLVSVISDGLQHLGQAAFVRGLVRR
jgi:uncharacterized damage-inducible protein DinB